jgi:beta-xylosidase
MTASSFNCTPGLPILHSRDLVNWTLVNHALRQVPGARYSEVQAGSGVWAPSLRFHDGKFWIFFPQPDEGIFVTTADDPRGRWSEPWLLQSARGWIDPCPFWDDDGRAYLFHAYAFSRSGKRDRIDVRPMSPDGRQLLGEGTMIIHAPHHPYLEGPKVHKFDGWYYVLAPGGGVPTGWQVAFRSRNILGPFEEKIVLEQGSTAINGPHQGALVECANGEWWFLHFQDTGPFGRIVHLQPAGWNNGWPEIGVDLDGNGVGEPVESWRKPVAGGTTAMASPPTTDEFDGPELCRQWQWHANHDPTWANVNDRPGWLRLVAVPRADFDLGRLPNFLGQKYPAREFFAATLIDFSRGRLGELAGLAVVGGKESVALAIQKCADGDAWVLVSGKTIERIGLLTTPMVRIGVRVEPVGSFVLFFATANGAWAQLPKRYHASEGGWLGAKVGLFAVATSVESECGSADFDWFRFSPRS